MSRRRFTPEERAALWRGYGLALDFLAYAGVDPLSRARGPAA
jgi:hypothetical protein